MTFPVRGLFLSSIKLTWNCDGIGLLSDLAAVTGCRCCVVVDSKGKKQLKIL
jgi:hypothetical protein